MNVQTDLSGMREMFYHAYCGTSFSPEKRAKGDMEAYTQLLNEDIEELEKLGAGEHMMPDYISKFKSMLGSYLSAKAQVMSSMITGPSNFPVARNKKRMATEDRRYEEFTQWRLKTRKYVKKMGEPEKTFLSEIDRLTKDLEKAMEFQEVMKATNKLIKKKYTAEMISQEIPQISLGNAIHLLQPDFANRIGFASYQMTNNLANIKRMQQRVDQLKVKESNAQESPIGETTYEIEGGHVELNHEEDRIRIFHKEKPVYEVIQMLKKNAFKWSPKNVCWQRQLTRNAIWSTNKMLNIDIKTNLTSN